MNSIQMYNGFSFRRFFAGMFIGLMISLTLVSILVASITVMMSAEKSAILEIERARVTELSALSVRLLRENTELSTSLAVISKENVQVKAQLAFIEAKLNSSQIARDNAEKIVKNAMVPEATISELFKNRIVTPASNAYDKIVSAMK